MGETNNRQAEHRAATGNGGTSMNNGERTARQSTGIAQRVWAAVILALAALCVCVSAAYADSYTDMVTTKSGNTYTVPGVHQSTNQTSVATFGSAMPLSTIYIDTSKIGEGLGTYQKLADESNPNQSSFAAGIMQLGDGTAAYNPTVEGTSLELRAGRDNYLAGELFRLPFPMRPS